MAIWALRFVLWFMCVLMTQPQNRFGFLIPFRIADLSVMGAAACHFMACQSEGRSLIGSGNATKFGLALFAAAFFSNLIGPLQTEHGWNAEMDIVAKNLVVLLMIDAMCTTPHRAWCAPATMAIAALWWIKGGLRLSAAGATYSGDRLMGPAVSLLENPNGFAYMMCVLIPLYLYFYQQLRSRFLKLLALAFAISSAYIVLETGSRTGLLSLIFLGVFLVPKYGSQHKVALVVIAAAIAVLSTSIGAMNIERFKSLGESIKSALSGTSSEKHVSQMSADEQSAWERREKNRQTWELIKRYPLGIGMYVADSMIPGDLNHARGQVHCEILAAGRQMGFVGMGLHALSIALIFANGHRIQKRCKGWWPAVADLGWTFKMQALVFAVAGTFSPLPWNVVNFICLGSSSALWTAVKDMPSPAQPAPAT